MSDERKLVHEIERGPGQAIRFSLNRFNGRMYADVRQFYESDFGEWLPTKKGVSVYPEQIDELIKGLEKLKKTWEGGNA